MHDPAEVAESLYQLQKFIKNYESIVLTNTILLRVANMYGETINYIRF